MTGTDYRDILNLVYLANKCEDTGSFIDTLFPRLMNVFKTECATFHLLKGYPMQMKVVESRSFRFDNDKLYEDKYYPNLYRKSFYHHSPLLTEALSSSKLVLKTGDSVSFQEWEKSVLYNEFIRPQHLYRELFLALHWENNLEGMITLWRSKKEPDYEEREVIKAAMIVPNLAVAIRNICLISQANREGVSSSAGKTNSEGFILLDHRYTPYFFNTKAREICMQLLSWVPYKRFDFGKREFLVPSYIIKDCSELYALLKIKKQAVICTKDRIISTESGRKFRIECSLIWKTNQIGSAPNFMVSLSCLNGGNRIESTLQDRYRLSRREMEVIYYLNRGMSDNEIGEKLYISRQTVHTHTKNIYKKLGTKSRIELYKKVGELAR